MNKIAINPSRLEWCLNTVQTDLEHLSVELNIAQKTLEQAMECKENQGEIKGAASLISYLPLLVRSKPSSSSPQTTQCSNPII